MKRLPLSRDGRDWVALALTALVVVGVLAWTSRRGGEVQWNYLVGFLIVVVIYAIFALGLSLEFGHTGLLNFGHVAFMLIGAYAYGILTMRPNDRPVDAAAPVGAFYDMAPALAGASAWGLLASLLLALVAAALALVPLLLLARRVPRLPPRAAMWGAIGLATLVGLATLLALYPLGEAGALRVAAVLAMLVGVALAAVAGLLLGLPTVRLREDYLAIVTIGAAEILRSAALNEQDWTRGTRNIVNFPRPVIDLALTSDAWRGFARGMDVLPASLAILAVGMVALVLVFVVLEALARSPWGRVLKAIREDEEAAAALGKNVLWYKLQSLMIGSAVAALAGILLVTYLANVAPQHFLPIVTFYAFIIVVIGGVGNHRGAIAGAFILWGIFSLSQNLPALARFGLTAGPPQAIFIGAALILVMMFRPQGLLGRKEELVHAK